jgi:hypothetical protein
VRYGVDLTARLYREAMTDVIVRALNEVVSSENGGLFVDLPGQDQKVFLLPKVWDERESVRLVKLALVYPDLLTASERSIWNRIRGNGRYWASPSAPDARLLDDLRPDRVEEDWDELKSQVDDVLSQTPNVGKDDDFGRAGKPTQKTKRKPA